MIWSKMGLQSVGDAGVMDQGVQFGAEDGRVPGTQADFVLTVQCGQPLAEGEVFVGVTDFPLVEHVFGVYAYLATDAGAQRLQIGRRDGFTDMEVAIPFVGVRHCSILLSARICLGLMTYFRVIC